MPLKLVLVLELGLQQRLGAVLLLVLALAAALPQCCAARL
jgi:hypothetical protein